jgi:hypothetical protein
MAAGRAFQVPVGISEGPGPGAHECERGIAHPDIRTHHTVCLLILAFFTYTTAPRIEVFLWMLALTSLWNILALEPLSEAWV